MTTYWFYQLFESDWIFTWHQILALSLILFEQPIDYFNYFKLLYVDYFDYIWVFDKSLEQRTAGYHLESDYHWPSPDS